MYRVDLHTHSAASHDGGIAYEDYYRALATQTLHMVAITDHGRIDYAQAIQARLGPAIIVGQQVASTDGEIIGLYLSYPVQNGMSAQDTAAAIKAQGGLVYIPYPYETLRHGLYDSALRSIAGMIDIVEIYNGRSVQDRSTVAAGFARAAGKAAAAGSDAHDFGSLGRNYCDLPYLPTPQTLPSLISQGQLVYQKPGLGNVAGPLFSRVVRKLQS